MRKNEAEDFLSVAKVVLMWLYVYESSTMDHKKILSDSQCEMKEKGKVPHLRQE